MYVCLCMFVYMYIFLCMYVCVYVCMFIYVCMYAYVLCMCVCVYVCVCIYIYMCVCVCVCMYVYIRMYACIFTATVSAFSEHLNVELGQKILKYVGVNKSAFLMHYSYTCIVSVILLNFIILCEHILVSKV
jgi:nuclear pore complex protein Nup62